MKKVVVSLLLIGGLLSACEEPKSFSSQLDLPEPQSQGAGILLTYCSECHAPPKPSAHKEGEWSNIVYRMQNHRVMHSMSAIEDDEVTILLTYMEKYASK